MLPPPPSPPPHLHPFEAVPVHPPRLHALIHRPREQEAARRPRRAPHAVLVRALLRELAREAAHGDVRRRRQRRRWGKKGRGRMGRPKRLSSAAAPCQNRMANYDPLRGRELETRAGEGEGKGPGGGGPQGVQAANSAGGGRWGEGGGQRNGNRIRAASARCLLQCIFRLGGSIAEDVWDQEKKRAALDSATRRRLAGGENRKWTTPPR